MEHLCLLHEVASNPSNHHAMTQEALEPVLVFLTVEDLDIRDKCIEILWLICTITGSILDELVLHKGLPTAVLHSLSTSWAGNASRAMGAPRALAFVERCLGFLLYLAYTRPGALTTNPTTDSLHSPSDGSDVGQVEFLDQFM